VGYSVTDITFILSVKADVAAITSITSRMSESVCVVPD